MKQDELTEQIPVGEVVLDADLGIPETLRGVVVFAHGSGSSRRSPRNRQVADALQEAGFATVLLDLLTEEEGALDARTRELRFDIDLLAARLAGAVDWVATRDDLAARPVATFGASTGAAAALIVAAQRPQAVHAVVSRGGRVDLAGEALNDVQAPCLFIVGGNDATVLDLNKQAAARLGDNARLEVVAGASHLFEESGALEQVITLTTEALGTWLS